MTSDIDPRHGDGRETSPSLREEDTCKPSATRKGHPKSPPVPHHPPFAQRRGTRAQRAGGCPNFATKTPQKPSSHAIPASHPSFPQAIRHSRGRGNPEKNKAHHFHPQHQTTPPPQNPLPQQPPHRSTQYPNNTTTVPSPASHLPPPPEGEIKRGSQGEGNRAAMGCGSTQTTNPLPHRKHP